MPPDDDEPEPPAGGSPSPAAGTPESPPSVPTWAGGGSEPSSEPSSEPIVPASWFAEPRQPAGESPAEQTRQLTPQVPGGPGDGWGAPVPPASQPGGYGDPAMGAGWQMQPGMHPDAGYPGADGYAHPNAGYPGAPGAYPHDAGYPMADGGYPPPEGTGGRAGGRANRSLAIAVGVLVAVALVAVVVVLRPDGKENATAGSTASATPRNATQQRPTGKPAGGRLGPAARQQAQEIDKLLDASAATRTQLGQALAVASKCKGLPTAIAGFQQVAQRRSAQIQRTNALKVDKLKNGEQVRAALLQSFQLSLQTDQAFLAWAQAAQGCKGRPRPDANYAQGNSLSAQATAAKKRFTALWNPIAQSAGLSPRTDRQF